MSVHSNDNSILKACGTLTHFEFGFKVFKDEDLIVSLMDPETQDLTPLKLNVDYTVSISRIGDGGSIELNETHNGYSLYAYREIEIIQPHEVPTEGYFPESTIENALDRGIMIDQQLQEQINRCIAIPGTSGFSGVNVQLPVPKAGNTLAWSEDETHLENFDVKGANNDFKADVNTTLANARSEFTTQITNFSNDVNSEISQFESSTNTQINNFKNEINTQITEVSEAAAKIKELEGAVQTAVEKADVATTKAETATTAATTATEQADRANGIANEMNNKFANIESFKNSFPAAVNLTTLARLNDGKLYNIPFDDVRADANQFIKYESTETRRSLRFRGNTFIKLITETDTRHFVLWSDLVINVEDYLDTGSTLINGKDYSIFLVPDGEKNVAIKISLNKTAPVGYNTVNTRRIGGFHTECKNVGTVKEGNAMNGWLAGDIIPNSVWTLWHKPLIASPSGARYVPERDAWKTIYSQSGTLENTVFEYGATTTRSRSAWDHELDLGLVGWEFPTSIDFTISELGIIPLKAVSGKAESSCTTAGGWVNENNIRMVTSGGDESTCGGLWTILQEYGPCGGQGWNASGVNTITSPRQYGSIQRLMGGGNWGSSGYAGPSSRNGADSALATSAGVSARGWSRPYRPRQ